MRSSVGRRYARALLAIGIERGNYERLQSQLRELADAYRDSKDLQAIIANPGVALDERRQIVRAIAEKAGWDVLIRNFAMLLLDNDRFKVVEAIAEEFDVLADEHAGNVRAHVTTAFELKDSQVARIKGAIAKMTGKNVLLETTVDPALLGGIVTQVGGTVYDGSVRTRLHSIRESILEEV